MKKRLLVILVLMLTVFVATTAGVLAASGINLVVNGTAVTNVEAKVIDGSTYVPLRAVSTMLGAEVGYDSTTKTAIITSNQFIVNNDDVENIRAYVRIADFYDQLDELGRSISSLANTFEMVYNHYMLGTDPDIDIDIAFKQFNDKVDRYNNYSGLISDTIQDAKNYNIDVSNINTIMSNYSSSIDYFRKSLVALENLSSQYSKQDYNTYFTNASTGMSYANDASLKAYNNYTYYIGLAK